MQMGKSLLVQRCSCRMGVDHACTGYRGSISCNGGQHLTWSEVGVILEQEQPQQGLARLRSRRERTQNEEGISV